MTHSFQALGTTWWIEVFDETENKTLTVAFADCERFVSDFKNTYSRFKTDSLISQLNTNREIIEPSKELQTLLSYGKNLYVQTNTHFNILTGHILETRGYDADYSFRANDESHFIVGNPISDLHISHERIALLQCNVDIGGFGKGYLIDKLVTLLREKYSVQFLLINAGGDMFATSNHGQAIEIYLEHPALEKVTIGKTSLLQQGFAASSPYKRRWKSGEKVHTHLIGETLTHHCSFVKHTTAAGADAFATVALLASDLEMERMSQSEHIGLAFLTPLQTHLRVTSSLQST